MRKIICRFRNQNDVDAFNQLNGKAISNRVTKYDLDTDVYAVKRDRKSSRKVNEAWKELWHDMPNYYEPKVIDFAKIDFSTDNLSSEDY